MSKAEGTSIDYGIMEKARNVVTFELDCGWDDLGSWTSLESLAEALNTKHGESVVSGGEVLSVESSGNIVDAPGRLVALLGIQDLIVVEHGGAILVARKDRAQDIRLIVVLVPSKVTAYRDVIRKDPALAENLLETLQHEEQLAKEVVTFLQQHQIEFADPAPAIRSCLAKGTRPYPESDDGHPNALGYTAIAETVLPLLTKKGL